MFQSTQRQVSNEPDLQSVSLDFLCDFQDAWIAPQLLNIWDVQTSLGWSAGGFVGVGGNWNTTSWWLDRARKSYFALRTCWAPFQWDQLGCEVAELFPSLHFQRMFRHETSWCDWMWMCVLVSIEWRYVRLCEAIPDCEECSWQRWFQDAFWLQKSRRLGTARCDTLNTRNILFRGELLSVHCVCVL